MKMLLLLLVTGLRGVSAQTAPPAGRYPRLSKTLDSLAYVDQWPMQRLFKQQPDTANRNLEQVEKENFAHHQPLLEHIVRRYGYPGFQQVGQKAPTISGCWCSMRTHTPRFNGECSN